MTDFELLKRKLQRDLETCKRVAAAMGVEHDNVALARDDGLDVFKGRSLPSAKYGAWLVDQVSRTLDGRCRLVTADLRGEQWVWARDLVAMFRVIDNDGTCCAQCGERLKGDRALRMGVCGLCEEEGV